MLKDTIKKNDEYDWLYKMSKKSLFFKDRVEELASEGLKTNCLFDAKNLFPKGFLRYPHMIRDITLQLSSQFRGTEITLMEYYLWQCMKFGK